jgi:hypothetical protein
MVWLWSFIFCVMRFRSQRKNMILYRVILNLDSYGLQVSFLVFMFITLLVLMVLGVDVVAYNTID